MQKIYQKEWFGIRFTEFSTPSLSNLAGPPFYSAFYKVFYRKYHSFSDLPPDWRKTKQLVVDQLTSAIDQVQAHRILSIGCGNGFVEAQLISALGKDRRLVALEPNSAASQWLKHPHILVRNGFFPQVVGHEDFDLAYASNIDYCFGDDEYASFLESVRTFGVPYLLLTDIPLNASARPAFRESLRASVHSLLRWLGADRKSQFWGFLRSADEHRTALRRAGWEIHSDGYLANNNYWILSKRPASSQQ